MKKRYLALGFLSFSIINTGMAKEAVFQGWRKSLSVAVGSSQMSQNQSIRLAETPAPGLTNRYVSKANSGVSLLVGLGWVWFR